VTLPYVLVLDDLWYWSRDQRKRVCQRLGLFDGSDGASPEKPADYIAIAEFRSGQTRRNGEIENDLSVAMHQIEARWNDDTDHRWALVLLDLQFDKGVVSEDEVDPNTNWPRDTESDFGLKILKTMIDRWPDRQSGGESSDIPVIVLSQFEKAQRGGAASRAGALRYVEKRELNRQLLGVLLDEMGLIEDVNGRILGHSPALLKTLRRAREVGRTARGNILILGPMGSGKTSLADYIHRHSPRRERALQRFTVSEGMDATLLKTQLYGFWYGAYTPADRSEAGLAERAHQSTLFLDEIGNLPPASQSELLEFGRLHADGLRSLSRLGTFPTSPVAAKKQAEATIIGNLALETQRIDVDVFLITATNKPLDDPDYVRRSGFLPDLLTRLGQEYYPSIAFPPMSDRREDVLLLFTKFLLQASEANQGAWPKVLDTEVVDRLRSHSWPGNVAEIQGVAREVERASRHWNEVHGHHLGTFDREISQIAVPLGGTDASSVAVKEAQDTEKPERTYGLSDAIESLRFIRVKGVRSELDGAVNNLQDAYSEALIHILSAALEQTRNVSSSATELSSRRNESLGDLNPTKAMKLLLRRPKLSTSEAQDQIKRLFLKTKVCPDPASEVGRVLAWARNGRRVTR
jgi:DNA-binding NtrC family response regulator